MNLRGAAIGSTIGRVFGLAGICLWAMLSGCHRASEVAGDDSGVDGADSMPHGKTGSGFGSETDARLLDDGTETASDINTVFDTTSDFVPQTDTDSDVGSDSDSGFDAAYDSSATVRVDTDGLFDLPMCNSSDGTEDVVAAQIQQIATGIDPCVCSQFHRLSMNVDWICHGGDFGFHGTLVFTGREPQRTAFETAFYRGLALSDLACLPGTTQIDGGTRTEGEQLVQIISNECGMNEEIVGRDMAAIVDNDGIVQVDAYAFESGHWTEEEVACANDILSAVDFPCLANTAIGAWVFPTIE